jgi:hypothetical protein
MVLMEPVGNNKRSRMEEYNENNFILGHKILNL